MKVSSVALRTQSSNKFSKVQSLPLTEDLLKAREYLVREISILTAKLNKKPDLHTWHSLAEVLGVRLTLFYWRRISEVFGMLITHFTDRNKWKS